jgi:hypothetical protein
MPRPLDSDAQSTCVLLPLILSQRRLVVARKSALTTSAAGPYSPGPARGPDPGGRAASRFKASAFGRIAPARSPPHESPVPDP